MINFELNDFENTGFIVIENFVSSDFSDLLKSDLINAIDSESKNLIDSFGDNFHRNDKNMVHNAFLYSKNLMDVLNIKKLRIYTDLLLCKSAIVYAFQTSSAPPFESNYGRRIHVDSPRFIPGYRTNLGFILALDDFNAENGGTEFLPGSHKTAQSPNENAFEFQKIQIACKKGDAIFFDARLWHRTGQNNTNQWRHALTINFCRPYMRSRFDFPKISGINNNLNSLESQAAKYLGFEVRMPSSLVEFYLPEDKRLYKSGLE